MHIVLFQFIGIYETHAAGIEKKKGKMKSLQLLRSVRQIETGQPLDVTLGKSPFTGGRDCDMQSRKRISGRIMIMQIFFYIIIDSYNIKLCVCLIHNLTK